MADIRLHLTVPCQKTNIWPFQSQPWQIQLSASEIILAHRFVSLVSTFTIHFDIKIIIILVLSATVELPYSGQILQPYN